MLTFLQAYVYFTAVLVTAVYAYDSSKGLKPIMALLFGLFFPLTIPFAMWAAFKVTKYWTFDHQADMSGPSVQSNH